MQDTPKGLRRHIALAGRRNAGKSTLVNALARQEVSIVSNTPGTTTDPVEKTMELAPLGPVVIVDTAGSDDEGGLGQMRVARSHAVLGRSDLAVLVTNGGEWGEAERNLADEFARLNVPFVVARNKADAGLPPLNRWRAGKIGESVPVVDISAKSGSGMEQLVAALVALAGINDGERKLLADLLPANGVVLLVVPLDTGAPKGRLILPQVQAVRDCLDGQKICLVSSEKQYADALRKLAAPPDLVVCDSQVVHEVAAQTPESVPMTTFSILMARFKGELAELARGAGALKKLKPGDSVLIQEACSHHAQEDDIGRVKIPRLLEKMAGGPLDISHAQGKELTGYREGIKAIVHCGACVITRRQMLARQGHAREQGIPMTNYGMAISLAQGILPRALALFPDALAAFSGEKPEENIGADKSAQA